MLGLVIFLKALTSRIMPIQADLILWFQQDSHQIIAWLTVFFSLQLCELYEDTLQDETVVTRLLRIYGIRHLLIYDGITLLPSTRLCSRYPDWFALPSEDIDASS